MKTLSMLDFEPRVSLKPTLLSIMSILHSLTLAANVVSAERFLLSPALHLFSHVPAPLIDVVVAPLL